DEDVLAGLCRGDDLVAVQRVRRREHYRVELAVRKQLRVTRHEADAMLLAERLRLGGSTGRAGDELYCCAVLRRLDEVAPPGADADDGRADHGIIDFARC